MIRRLITAIVCIVTLLSCTPNQSFTVSGQLFKGTTDLPLNNNEVTLVGIYTRATSSYYEDIAVGQTDSDGSFSLTYKTPDGAGSGDEGIEFYIGKSSTNPYVRFDWNRDIDLGRIAEIPHRRILINITPVSPVLDTLFLSVGNLLESQFIDTVNYDYGTSISELQVLAIPPEFLSSGSTFPVFFKTYGASKNDWSFKYAIGRGELIATTSNSDLNKVTSPLRGFPFTDEIKLTLP